MTLSPKTETLFQELAGLLGQDPNVLANALLQQAPEDMADNRT